VVTLGLVHGLGSVTRAQLPPGAEAGLWMASAAMYLLVSEAVLGLYLREPGSPWRPRLRRWHLALMLMAVVAVTVHVVLDGPFPP
jgi:hypothetical protein